MYLKFECHIGISKEDLEKFRTLILSNINNPDIIEKVNYFIDNQTLGEPIVIELAELLSGTPFVNIDGFLTWIQSMVHLGKTDVHQRPQQNRYDVN